MIFDNLGMIFLIHKNPCCGCSLESPRRGDSNEHPQDRDLAILISTHNIGFYEDLTKIIFYLSSDLMTFSYQAKKVKEDVEQQEQELEAERKRQVELEKSLKEEEERKKRLLLRRKKELLIKQEKELREKILKNWKTVEEKKQEQLRESLRNKISGKKVLKSSVVMKR